MKRFDEAIADYERAIALNPTDPEYAKDRDAAVLKRVLDQAEAAFDAEEYQRASGYLDQALFMNPDNVEVLCDRAAVRSELGRDEDALADLNRALAINPQYKEAYAGRADIHSELGDFERALADWDMAISLDPSDDELVEQRADTVAKMAQRPRVETSCVRALHCTKCGARLPADGDFCPMCGTRTTSTGASSTRASSTRASSTDGPYAIPAQAPAPVPASAVQMERLVVEAEEGRMAFGKSMFMNIVAGATSLRKCRFGTSITSPGGDSTDLYVVDFEKAINIPIEDLSGSDRRHAQDALESLDRLIAADGWHRLDNGTYWYSRRYERPFKR